MPAPSEPRPPDLRQFAYEKIARVLGPERATQLMVTLVDDLGFELRTAEDLLALSERMTELEGFERAVGAMLGVAAVMRGATPAR